MRVPIDDVELDLLDEGKGTPIVLLHPFPLSKEIWDIPAAALRAHARILRFDLRGMGKSSAPAGPYLMETLAGDLAGILDARDIDRAVIVGNSVGVMIAFAFQRMFAERVLGLGLIGGRATADDPQTARTRMETADRIEREGAAALADIYLPRLFPPGFHLKRPECVAELRAAIERTDLRGAAALLRGMALRDDASDLLEEIAVPVRVIAGTHDPLALPSEMLALSERIPGAAFHAIACGHVPAIEAPEELIPILEALLEDARTASVRA